MTSTPNDLARRLSERAHAFNDAGLTFGVADLLTEAATMLARIELLCDREGLAEALFYAARRDDWGVANEDEREEFLDQADPIRALILGNDAGVYGAPEVSSLTPGALSTVKRDAQISVVNRMDSIVRLCYPDDMTPAAKRMIEAALISYR